MTDEQIADSIFTAARKSLIRFAKAGAVTQDERDRAAVAEFLSGANQAMHYLIANDGAITPQQIQRALAIAGDRMGFKLAHL